MQILQLSLVASNIHIQKVTDERRWHVTVEF